MKLCRCPTPNFFSFLTWYQINCPVSTSVISCQIYFKSRSLYLRSSALQFPLFSYHDFYVDRKNHYLAINASILSFYKIFVHFTFLFPDNSTPLSLFLSSKKTCKSLTVSHEHGECTPRSLTPYLIHF